MAQKDVTPPTRYIQVVRDLLDDPFGLSLPFAVFETAARRAFAAGLGPEEAAIRLCHDHARLVAQSWIEDGVMASDLAEVVISARIDESAKLASQAEEDLLDLLPDLPDFVCQPCFSDEFRVMVANIATWHGIPAHRVCPMESHEPRLQGLPA